MDGYKTKLLMKIRSKKARAELFQAQAHIMLELKIPEENITRLISIVSKPIEFYYLDDE